MNKQQLDERIERQVCSWFREPVLAVEDEIKQLISDVLDEVVPGRPDNQLIQAALQGGKPQQAASYNGYAAAIDTITRERKRLGL